jgi:hypothetical protein
MNFITIDFSLNSPGICIFSKGRYYFIGYLKPGTGTKTEQKLQEELNLLEDTRITYQPDWTNNEAYSKSEMIKIQRHTQTANDIINMIIEIAGDESQFVIAFEGSSYGSSGGTNNIIDMAAGAAILKMELMSRLKVKDMMTIAPSTIKKFIHKGNMNKREIWPYFLNYKEDINIALIDYCNKYIGNDIKNVPKPLDDLIDAFFMLKYVLSIYNKDI